MKKLTFSILLLSLVLCSSSFAQDEKSVQEAKYIPIQNNGRIKSFDSFARQTLERITGKDRWQKKEAVAILLEMLGDEKKIAGEAWIHINHTGLKKKLGLDPGKDFFSLETLKPLNDQIMELVQSAKQKRDQDLRPEKLEQKAESLWIQIKTVEKLVSGELITVIPHEKAWLSPFIVYPGSKWTDHTAQAPSPEISKNKIALEVFYTSYKPFEWASFIYFLAFFILTLCKQKKTLFKIGILSLGLAFCLHTLGIALRVIVLGRPPVSNMYESMIFMTWALVLFACFFSMIQRNTLALAVSALAGSLVMIYGNLLPIDAHMEVLVPVLRSNYWLTIHVMTIVSSYGAFGLAMALGHRHLIRQSSGEWSKATQEESSWLIYRVIQLGTILIGTGTFLGGVWANESWGRFWGWDPKETWAFISFLVYLAIVHLYYLKKIGSFGLALWSVLGFQFILMTWYGVNFVLGRGLHSYGAGTGGMQWVIYYLIFEAIFLGWVAYSFQNLQKRNIRR